MVWTCTPRRLGRDFAQNWEDEAREQPSVLFESPDGAEAHAAWRMLRRHGFRTMWCPGPQEGTECALVTTGRCQLVDDADAVVSSLDLAEPECQDVARGLNAVAEDVPVVVVAPRASAPRWEEELPACRVVAGPLSTKVLIRALDVAGAPPPAPGAQGGRPAAR